MLQPAQLKDRLATTTFTFRGYNQTNLGRTPELLAHPAYGAVMEAALRQSSELCSDVLGRHVDLLDRVRCARETSDLTTYAEDLALIVTVSLAQVQMLEQFFGISIQKTKLTFGYSLGEATAVIATGMYKLEDLLRVPLALADDSAELAKDVTMGILFSRGPALDLPTIERMCLEITQKQHGTIAMSTCLSPNCVLLLGQEDTVAEFGTMISARLKPQTYLRRNSQSWPPLHTPITWQKAIPNRAALMLQTLPGGFTAPKPAIVSGVTGQPSYNDHNSRALLHRWVDHYQLLWDQIMQTFNAGVETVVHVGPEPTLIPATFRRLSDDIRGQLAGYSPSSLGLRAISHVVRRPWLAQLLPKNAVLFRAPFIEQYNLEDWLLEQPRTKI